MLWWAAHQEDYKDLVLGVRAILVWPAGNPDVERLFGKQNSETFINTSLEAESSPCCVAQAECNSVEEDDGVECDDGEDEDKDGAEGSDGYGMGFEAGDGDETPVAVARQSLARAESLD